MDVAAELGGIAALTGAIVIVTGIVGALLAETVCKLFHITDPIAKGVGIGTAAHAVGTSKALQMGEASRVAPIDKLSVVITMILAFVVLHETVTVKGVIGGILIAAGTLFMIL